MSSGWWCRHSVGTGIDGEHLSATRNFRWPQSNTCGCLTLSRMSDVTRNFALPSIEHLKEIAEFLEGFMTSLKRTMFSTCTKNLKPYKRRCFSQCQPSVRLLTSLWRVTGKGTRGSSLGGPTGFTHYNLKHSLRCSREYPAVNTEISLSNSMRNKSFFRCKII